MPLIRRYTKRIVMIGCGSVGQGLLPVLFDSFGITPAQLIIITADDKGRHVAEQFGVNYLVEPLTPKNYQSILGHHLQAGDLLLNLSVDVSSVALIAWCKARDVLYLDTCVEPWSGGYVADDPDAPTTTNAWLRQQALALHTPGAATAIIAHGMNPGLVSHLLKEALLVLARNKCIAAGPTPSWGELAQTLGVKAVHVSERDTQDDNLPLMRGEFTNTWSAEGLYSEGWLQRAEIGWGSHEDVMPTDARASGRTLCLARHGAELHMRSWLPTHGELQGMAITHHEVVSMTELLTADRYCPTVCYVYNPCPKARVSLANLRAGIPVADFHVLASETLQGFDEVGILLVHDSGALWHGSILSAEGAQQLAPHNSATSMQVVAGIVGAMAWMLDHPHAGVVEAEDIDSERVLAVARPYLGKLVTIETDWRPGPHLTFDEFLLADETCPDETSP